MTESRWRVPLADPVVDDELVEAAEQLVVGDGMEREFGVHENNIGRGFGASQEDERLHQRASVVARGSLRDCAARGARRCVTRGFTRASLGARRVAPESCQGVAEKTTPDMQEAARTRDPGLQPS